MKEKDGIIKMTLESAMMKSINPDNAEFLLEHLVGMSNINRIFNKEYIFFSSLENICSSVSDFKIIRQYKCLDYSIDGVITEAFDNFGEYDTSKQVIVKITCIEFDEIYHESKIQKQKDEFRQSRILKKLKDEFDIVEFIRVNEADSFRFLAYAISYFSGIETTYSRDKIYEFVTDYIEFEKYIKKSDYKNKWNN